MTEAKTEAKQSVRIIDTSLRDGSHAMSHKFTVEQVRDVAQALDEAGVAVIECNHGDGLPGSSINYGFSKESEMDLISEAVGVCEQAKIAALLLPGVGTVERLKEAVERGIGVFASPPTAPRPTSPRSTSRWPRRWTWRRSAS